MSLDVTTVRKDFPVLSERINGAPLVYLDSANTSQKPQVVIDALAEFMSTQNAPINRSAYHFAAQATERFESTRSKLATLPIPAAAAMRSVTARCNSAAT